MQELPIAKADGRYPKLLREFANTELRILGDWGLMPMNDETRRDLLEILDERHNQRSTLVTGQLPVDTCTRILANPRLPMPSLIGSYTTLIESSSKENPCEKNPPT